jgi:hypothetical protein
MLLNPEPSMASTAKRSWMHWTMQSRSMLRNMGSALPTLSEFQKPSGVLLMSSLLGTGGQQSAVLCCRS